MKEATEAVITRDGRFLSTLRDLSAGDAEGELNHVQALVVQGVRMTGKPGTITLKLKYQPAGRGMEAFHIDYAISKTLPVSAKRLTLFFPTTDGRLVRQDPNQLEMPLREFAPSEDKPLRTINIDEAPAKEVAA